MTVTTQETLRVTRRFLSPRRAGPSA